MEPLPSSVPHSSERDIRSLIQLLSDPNPRIAQTIHTRLVEIGSPALAFLTPARDDDPAMSERITQVIEDIHQQSIRSRFRRMVASNPTTMNLEEGTFLIAALAYPDLEKEGYQARLTDMSTDIADRFTIAMQIHEQIQTMNRYLFIEQGFKGNAKDYYDPDNTFLNRVLDRRVGIPISLSVMYLLIGQRLGLPLRGVGMPGHFLVGLETEELFIDCFNGGTLLSQVECSRILRESGHGFEPRFLNTSSNQQILLRMLRNLLAIYQGRDEPHQARHCQELLEILVPPPPI